MQFLHLNFVFEHLDMVFLIRNEPEIYHIYRNEPPHQNSCYYFGSQRPEVASFLCGALTLVSLANMAALHAVHL